MLKKERNSMKIVFIAFLLIILPRPVEKLKNKTDNYITLEDDGELVNGYYKNEEIIPFSTEGF